MDPHTSQPDAELGADPAATDRNRPWMQVSVTPSGFVLVPVVDLSLMRARAIEVENILFVSGQVHELTQPARTELLDQAGRSVTAIARQLGAWANGQGGA